MALGMPQAMNWPNVQGANELESYLSLEKDKEINKKAPVFVILSNWST